MANDHSPFCQHHLQSTQKVPDWTVADLKPSSKQSADLQLCYSFCGHLFFIAAATCGGRRHQHAYIAVWEWLLLSSYEVAQLILVFTRYFSVWALKTGLQYNLCTHTLHYVYNLPQSWWAVRLEIVRHKPGDTTIIFYLSFLMYQYIKMKYSCPNRYQHCSHC